MKVIANIPEEMLQELKDGCFGAKHTLYDLAGAICNGVVLPDNATNGDVIKAMFPNELLTSITSTLWWGDNMSFNKNWWNAPYKKENE